MKRNGRNLKMPKVEGMTSDEWSTMTNMQRYDFLAQLKAQEIEQRKAKKNTKVKVVE